jgi:poly-gamma-glutamate synthesis protein (capsule biosynthesis protein)
MKGLAGAWALIVVVLLTACFPPKARSENQVIVQAQGDRLTLAVVGDIMLSRTVDKVIQNNSWQVPFASIPKTLQSSDIAFANLECPASFRGKPYPGKPEDVTFRANPAALMGLKYAGFDVVSLANNHTNDYGPRALTDTLLSLAQLDIAACGAGSSREEAHKAAIIERNGIRLAFIAYAEPILFFLKPPRGPPPGNPV